MFLSCYYIDNEFRHNIVIHKFIIYEMRQRTRVGCEQASGGANADQTLEFGAKRRVIGACMHSPKSPMSASKFGTQSGDWWIIIIAFDEVERKPNCCVTMESWLPCVRL